MTRILTCLARVGAVLLAVLAVWTAPSAAQDVTAEVRTWAGQSVRIAQPSLEVFYTIPVPPKGGQEPYAAPPSGTAEAASNTQQGLQMSGPLASLQSHFEGGPAPKQGHRQADYITVRRAGIERQLPFASIASIAFTRYLVRSSLPPYIVNQHFRYTAIVMLTDGSRVEADYINLGTLVLRGQTNEGRLDFPWEQIQSVSFQR